MLSIIQGGIEENNPDFHVGDVQEKESYKRKGT